jgi:hypothetical protein
MVASVEASKYYLPLQRWSKLIILLLFLLLMAISAVQSCSSLLYYHICYYRLLIVPQHYRPTGKLLQNNANHSYRHGQWCFVMLSLASKETWDFFIGTTFYVYLLCTSVDLEKQFYYYLWCLNRHISRQCSHCNCSAHKLHLFDSASTSCLSAISTDQLDLSLNSVSVMFAWMSKSKA